MRSVPLTCSRRSILAGLGVGVLAALGLGAARWQSSALTEAEETLADLRPGMALDRWTVVAVHPVHLGAIPVVLATADGIRFQVDVMARDPEGPPGVAQTEHLSLYLRNRGDGQTATDEEQGLGAMSLARVLRARESEGVTVPPLLTLAERHRRHPDGAFGVPLS
jgi:hypothetical protein